MGDVRQPLTQYSQLGREGIDRLDKMLPLVHEVESYAKSMLFESGLDDQATGLRQTANR